MSAPSSPSPLFRSVAGLSLAALLSYSLYLLFRPFLMPLLTGAIIALISRPVYLFFLRRIPSPSLAASLTILTLILLIILPLYLILSVLVREISHLSVVIRSDNFSLENFNRLFSNFLDLFSISRESVQVDPRDSLLKVISFIGSKGGIFIGGLFGALGSALLTLITAYYLLQNYEPIKEKIRVISPLSQGDTGHLLRRTKEVIQATVSGSLLLLILQTIVSMIGFTIFGIGSPVILGILYGLSSLVPTVGTTLVWVPVLIFQLLGGNYLAGLGIAIWSLSQVLILDNYLGPRLMEKRARLHPFLVLLGVLGGVTQFGIIGLILGPTIMAVGIVGVEILHRAWQVQSD